MEIPSLDERLAALAGRLRSLHDGSAAVVEAASVLEVLASAGATGPLVVTESAAGTGEMTRQLSAALGLGWTNEHAWDDLLTRVRELTTRVDAIREEFRHWVESSREGVRWEAVGRALGLDGVVGTRDVVDAARNLVTRIEALERDLDNERGDVHRVADELETFTRELSGILGTDTGRDAIARRKIVGDVRVLVQRLAANAKGAQRLLADAQRAYDGTRGVLVDMLKALQTYAPGHEEMSPEDLRAEVNTVLARTLKDLHTERKVTAGLTAHVRAVNTRLAVSPWASAEEGARAIAALQEQVEQARLRIDRAKVAHLADSGGNCATCDVEWPCQTRTALDPGASAEDDPEDEPDLDLGQDDGGPW